MLLEREWKGTIRAEERVYKLKPEEPGRLLRRTNYGALSCLKVIIWLEKGTMNSPLGIK